MLNADHLALLTARGLDSETLVRFGVESNVKLGTSCVVIPFHRDGQVVNRKFRTIAGDKQFSQDAGAVKCFWNIDAITDPALANEPLIITEGEFDAMIAIQCGYQRTVSVPDGAPAEKIGDGESRKYDYLDNAPQGLKEAREIILATDGDGPGTNLMHDLALRLGRARCKWVKYPKGCKDLNDAFKAYGERGVTETIRRAQWVKVTGLYRMSELPPVNEPEAHPTGIIGLEKHYKIRLGDLAVITGIPGHGKTTLVNEIAGRLAMKGWGVCFASFEQRPQTDHRRALRTFYTGRKVIYQHEVEIQTADAWIDKQFSFIVPDDDEDAGLDWVLEAAAAAIIQHGAKLIVIDPWNEMDHVRPPDTTMTEYTGLAIKRLKKFARKFWVHVIVVAHPAKIARLKDGKIPVPTLYDISDSAHWHNKPDIGLIVHRTDDITTMIRAEKVRYDAIGVRGDVFGSFNVDTARYQMIEEPRVVGIHQPYDASEAA